MDKKQCGHEILIQLVFVLNKQVWDWSRLTARHRLWRGAVPLAGGNDGHPQCWGALDGLPPHESCVCDLGLPASCPGWPARSRQMAGRKPRRNLYGWGCGEIMDFGVQQNRHESRFCFLTSHMILGKSLYVFGHWFPLWKIKTAIHIC